ncbi:MAG TPA: S41 family peptidase [Pyrinomonadaceae bacterium]|nr:S41 family peptidase [Pyrinomonadaceae bacterium]
MKLRSRLFHSSIALFCVASSLTAQARFPFDKPVEPFSISRGTFFEVSGSDPANALLPNGERPSKIATEILEAEELIRKQHIDGKKVTFQSMTRSALVGALKSLDPHSDFYDADEWREFLEEEESTYAGIGTTIATYTRNGVDSTYILGTFAGTAAAGAKFKYGDRFMNINGTDVSEMESDDVRELLRGAPGTTLKVTVERAATGKLEAFYLRRGTIPQPSIPDAYIVRPTVGYVAMTEGFTHTTGREFDDAVRKLTTQGMKSLVIDLRGNGGGIVDQSIKVAERFLPRGTTILTQKGRSRIDNKVWKSNVVNQLNIPVVLLVDEDTASASEIVAGALQDRDRALIVGTRTFGKGLVQSVMDLPGNTGMTLTSARYLTPSGRSIQRDYTSVGHYDYYKHSTQTAAIDRPFVETRTVTNRKVFGGDGIQPDEIVERPALTDAQVALQEPMFFFARDVVNGRVAGLDVEIALADTRALSVAFVKFMAANRGFNIANNVVEKESAFLANRLKYEIVLSQFGVTAADRVLLEDDVQAAKAVASLPRAAELARVSSSIK